MSPGGPTGPDRYGAAPRAASREEIVADPDPTRAQRAMQAVQAVLGMQERDVAALRAAADGVPVG